VRNEQHLLPTGLKEEVHALQWLLNTGARGALMLLLDLADAGD
jgi:hypothetical protein